MIREQIRQPDGNTAAAQHYHPYRAQILSAEQFRSLNRLRPSVAVRGTILDWACIIAGWALVAWYPSIWTVAVAIPIIGTSYYALSIIGHDGLHRRIFPSIAANDLWNDLFILGPIGAITRINRHNHMEHHRATCLPHDPDRHKYLHDGKDGLFNYAFFLSGLQSIVPSLVNIFVRRGAASPDVAKNGESHGIRDLAILAGWQAVLIGGLTISFGWWGYPLLWLVPVYVFAYRADLVRVFCEHSMLTSDDEADHHRRMITYTSSWLERRFCAPHNMNFHTAHHLWPSIPFYNLPAADALVRTWASKNDTEACLIWRKSYLAYILRYWLWRRAQPAVIGVAA